ncbi:MAG TPA: glycosyltransferase family 25 protein [Ramlibacter sp.]|nr:glycosyltransferase family 25 protein [Ramlibacter sp.]
MQAVQVISLKRSALRRAAFAKLNEHLNYEFWDAVDGHEMSYAEFMATGLFEEGLPYTAGAFGCALSHLRLWERAIETGQPLTIAEDDAIFRLDFHEQQARALERLSPDWDIVLWGWNFDAALSLNLMPGVSPTIVMMDHGQMVNSIENFQYADTEPSLLRLERCFGNPCYTISPAGARRFKARCFPIMRSESMFPLIAVPVPNTGIDNSMNRVFWQRQSFISLPPLVVTKNERAVSTIQNATYHEELVGVLRSAASQSHSRPEMTPPPRQTSPA